MDVIPKKELNLSRVVWIVVPSTYALAITLFLLSGLVLDQFGGNTTVTIAEQEVRSVTARWLRYAWYQSAFVQVIALAHAVFCFCMVIRFRHKTNLHWFKMFAVLFASIYIAYVIYLTYGFFYPDPSIERIDDHF